MKRKKGGMERGRRGLKAATQPMEQRHLQAARKPPQLWARPDQDVLRAVTPPRPPSFPHAQVQVTPHWLLGLFTPENKDKWRTKFPANSEPATKVDAPVPSPGVPAQQRPVCQGCPWALDWERLEPLQGVQEAFSCGICPGYTLMSTSNLKFSGADIQSQARRENAQLR
ncbi:hypothetical protein LEMLEM_LOCUS12181 [Lemmus lemmus]